MAVQEQIAEYIASQPTPKREDMARLHRLIADQSPDGRLWFLDGKDGTGKIISNPNIGYGSITICYTNGKSRDFYRIGISANTTGISIYIMGLDDKKCLSSRFEGRLGKASITGYCIKFKALEDLDPRMLAEVIRFGLAERDSR